MGLKLAVKRVLCIREVSNVASRGIVTFKLPELSYNFGALLKWKGTLELDFNHDDFLTDHGAARDEASRILCQQSNNALLQYAEMSTAKSPEYYRSPK
jgi:hypothetical protein